MLLPCSLLYAVLFRHVTRLLVATLSVIVPDLPLLLCVLLLIALLFSLLLGMILLAVITLLPISLRSILLSILIVSLLFCVLRLLALLGPLLLTVLFGLPLLVFGLLVLGFFLVRMAPVLVLLVMLCVHRNSDSQKQRCNGCADNSSCFHTVLPPMIFPSAA